jgi:hypothetical protein
LLRNGICRSRCTIFRFDKKQLFLEGYGLSSRQISAISPVLKALTRINYRPEVQRALNPKNAAQLERYRARLAGRLDLYSLLFALKLATRTVDILALELEPKY